MKNQSSEHGAQPFVQRPPQRAYVGAHLLLLQDDQILLMKRTVKDSMDGMYAAIAGKVEEGESPLDAVLREATEEAAIRLDAGDVHFLATVHHAASIYRAEIVDVIEFYFVARKWSGTPVICEPDKASEMAFFPLDNLPDPLPQGLLAALSALQGGACYIEK